MVYPPQLNPVQAWLLGYIDRATLGDVIAAVDASEELSALAVAVGRAQTDEAYASSLIAKAQAALGEVLE